MDWKRKLTSRKFWIAVAQFVAMLIVCFKGTEEMAERITALIMAGAAVVAYIVGEGMTDAASAGQTQNNTFVLSEEPEEEKTDEGQGR